MKGSEVRVISVSAIALVATLTSGTANACSSAFDELAHGKTVMLRSVHSNSDRDLTLVEKPMPTALVAMVASQTSRAIAYSIDTSSCTLTLQSNWVYKFLPEKVIATFMFRGSVHDQEEYQATVAVVAAVRQR